MDSTATPTLSHHTGHRTQDTEHRTQDTGHRTQDTQAQRRGEEIYSGMEENDDDDDEADE